MDLESIKIRAKRYKTLRFARRWCSFLIDAARSPVAPERRVIDKGWAHHAEADRAAGKPAMYVCEYYIMQEIEPHLRIIQAELLHLESNMAKDVESLLAILADLRLNASKSTAEASLEALPGGGSTLNV